MAEKQALQAAVLEYMNSAYYYCRSGNGDSVCFEMEVFANYDDSMSEKEAAEILSSPNPEDEFNDRIFEWYAETEDNQFDELLAEVNTALEKDSRFIDGLDDGDYEEIKDYLRDITASVFPFERYLKQSFCTDILVDTGDGNYDFTLNNHYPSYCGSDKGSSISRLAGITWLAKSQGYTKGALRKALDNGDTSKDPKGFLQSMYVEEANSCSHMNVVTFLVRMTFRELLLLNKLIRQQDRNGMNYDASKNPDCGYLIIGKEIEGVGLFNPWDGGGSLLEVQLEKDVKLPIKYIWKALPDEGIKPYCVGSVYGLCQSAWTENTIKEIHVPAKLKQAVDA